MRVPPPQPGSHEDEQLVDIDQARDAIARCVWPETPGSDRLGLEIEAFPIRTLNGEVGERLALQGPAGVQDTVEHAGSAQGPIGVRGAEATGIPTTTGGRITFEPGGQIEYSSAPADDVGELFADVDMVWDQLEASFAEQNVDLVPLGIDPWHGVDEVPQQLNAPRYEAMERYFEGRWPAGAMMMRNSAALQPNLDSGAGEERRERWLAANLMAPFLAAMFNTSPGLDGNANVRSLTWRSIDATRTGLPTWSSIEAADPLDDVAERALAANVIFVLRDGTCHEPGPGWTFSEWITDPPSAVGRPSISDLLTHMSTIFDEVRPRAGILELRSIDALPRRWWPVPVVVTAAALYDGQARGQVIDLLSNVATDLSDLLLVAATGGLQESRLADPAHKLVRIALDAACREDRIPSWAVARAEEFCERFTMRCRAPADEILALLEDPPALLRWVRDPSS